MRWTGIVNKTGDEDGSRTEDIIYFCCGLDSVLQISASGTVLCE